MSIMTRMIRLWKADIHGVMDQLEDKSLMLNQYLRDMEEALEKHEAELKHLNTSRTQTKEEYEKYEADIQKLEKDLNAAIEKDKDDIARFLIKKLKPMRTYHEELGRHMKKLDREAAQVRETLEERRLQYERLRLKSREYFRKNERDEWKQTISSLEPDSMYQEPCEEEIELELLRRKEAVKGGDKP